MYVSIMLGSHTQDPRWIPGEFPIDLGGNEALAIASAESLSLSIYMHIQHIKLIMYVREGERERDTSGLRPCHPTSFSRTSTRSKRTEKNLFGRKT